MTDSAVVVAALGISSIDVQLSGKSEKELTSFEAKMGNHILCRCAASQGSNGRSLRQNITPVLALTDCFTVTIQYITSKRWNLKHHIDIAFDPQEFVSGPRNSEEGKQEFRKGSKNIEVIIRLSSDIGASATDHNITRQLTPTTHGILEICPRFRLLVIGKTGVGKSSLIHRAFGITGVKIEDDKRGEANIDTEFTSSENARFVLHDSQGFESGEEDRVKIVKDFIARRRDMPQLKDRVHAIWLCLAAPHAQGRVFETGVEDFFKNKQEILGDIPIITVFTKLDLLDNAIEMETVETEAVEAEQRRAIEERCIKPLKDAGGDNLSHAVVSTKKDYEYTIIDLLQTTVNNVEKYVTTKGASLTGKIAQRANIDLKIDASIDVGKKKYWRNLAASADFKGHTLLDCFFVIHTDIVAVWNFQDPKNYLIGEELRKSMVEMVSDLATPPSVDPNKTLKFGLSAVASIAGILGSVAGPAMTVVVPVLAVAVIAAWAYAVYQQSHEVIKRLMLYIVNLTLVMEMLFLLAPEQVSMDDIKKAIQIYENAPAGKHQTRCKILNYDHSAITTAGRDHALQFIEKLIKEASIDAGEAPDLQKKIAETIHH